ncbi:unnamed protein product [Caenorhabditis bovis]|uniref:Uncharacterized protein n=1 Tax=Caenorhabditis bovis TaxID=2654633 RepID=A0A8S1EPG9_9PELO|nr:unnamed protein product [Caenorhabditis bovis]
MSTFSMTMLLKQLLVVLISCLLAQAAVPRTKPCRSIDECQLMASINELEYVINPEMSERYPRPDNFKVKRDYDFVRFGRSAPSKKASYDYIRFGRK